MAPETSQLLSGWRVQARTIHALLVRELMVRYGRNNIGFVWVILEPMILCVGVMFIWSILGGHGKEGIKVVELVLTGYMPLTLWRHLTGMVLGMFRNNVGMIYHRRVSLLDLVLARQLLEIIGTTAALLVIYSFLVITGLAEGFRRLDLVLLGWLMMAWIGVAFGALLACWSERQEVVERFVQPLQYLNIPISGAFFLVDWLPHWAQNVIMYHPLVHCWEVFRAGYFGDTIVSHYDLAYFAACAFGISFWALCSVQRIRAYVRLS
jgi:capsular polysaccharide transport system permease protein